MEQHIEIVYRTTIIVYIRLFIETFRKEVEFKFKSRWILFWIFCVANFFLFFFFLLIIISIMIVIGDSNFTII